ncbi:MULTISPECIES: biotin/lipoyl-binding protein [unclassified Roseburia]|uniref:biotin/lipoyl-binding protein n=1 Tax=unclassified Roseburia TaxID=2637578 RepID=UPI000E50109B|nr:MULTISPECIES: biotin/lipoyl-binding protein [unclassified Roseburia]RGI47753.1 biotin/lipoyl-binding protein [Roseburia sp. OM03-7AC]RGI51201.1 biotin/lipoyl-binding protein [Roseburia sp. OM03-18]
MRKKKSYAGNAQSVIPVVLTGLFFVMLIGGCGSKKTETIPDLEEPAASNASYQQVTYGNIGTTNVLLGTAVPKEYGQAYEANVTVTKILVEPGDTVEKGDVLAYADVDEASASRKAKQQELSHENTVYELNQKINQLKQDKLANQQKQQDTAENNIQDAAENNIQEEDNMQESATENNTQETEAEDITSQIAVLQENSRYDTKLHEYRVQKLNEEIAALDALIADGTLKANHSGEVVYTKSLTVSRNAGTGENVVVVADTEDLAIELKDVTVQNYKYKDVPEKYMLQSGERVPVTEREYSTDELVLAKINNNYPNVLIEKPEGVELKAGELYPIYFEEKRAEHVLLVGNNSLYQEDGETYVYVKAGDDTREKRKVTAGAADDHNTQITDGLEEGEAVYYETMERMPSDYTEYMVERSDFQVENHGLKYGRADKNARVYLTEKEGVLVEIAVEKDAEVKKGDLLYIIDTGEGKAAITEAANAIETENTSYQKQQADYDAQLIELQNATDSVSDYDRQIITLQKEVAEADHSYTLQQLQAAYDTLSRGNDGTGKLSVYADADGQVSKITAWEGDTVEAGEEILKMKGEASDLLLVQMVSSKSVTVYTDDIAEAGEPVSITSGDTTYTGTCVGFAAGSNNLDEGCLYIDENGAHYTFQTTSGYDTPAFYVRMNDEIVDDMGNGESVDFPYISMEDVIVLPAGMIYEEKDAMHPDKVSYFVWKIEGDHLVKQYVLLDDTLTGNGKVVLFGIESGDVLARE